MDGTKRRKHLQGKVVSEKMDKTRVVIVERSVRHPLYGKVLRKRKKFYIHDPKNESHLGDVIEFRETRPLSKLKRWCLETILVKSK